LRREKKKERGHFCFWGSPINHEKARSLSLASWREEAQSYSPQCSGRKKASKKLIPDREMEKGELLLSGPGQDDGEGKQTQDRAEIATEEERKQGGDCPSSCN